MARSPLPTPSAVSSGLRDRVRSWHPEELVNDLLVDGETVYAYASPDPRIIVLDQAPFGILGLAVTALASSFVGAGAALVVLVALVVALGWRALDAWYTRYVLTSFRVLRLAGVLDRNVEFIPWRKVTDVSLRRSFWQRVVGASTIRIESANEASRFRAMTDVRDPRQFFRTLQDVMAAYSGRVEVEGIGPVDISRHGPHGTPPPGGDT